MDGYEGRKTSAYSQRPLSLLDQADLLKLRAMYSNNPQAQAVMAPLEHQAFAREYAQASPLTGGASLAVAIPAYTLAKYLNLPMVQGARSRPSMNELLSGYQGLGEGLLQAGAQRFGGLLK